MGKLSGVSRDELLHYREHEGMTYAEIAEKFDCTPAAIYQKIGGYGKKRNGEQPGIKLYKTAIAIQPIVPERLSVTYEHKGIVFGLNAGRPIVEGKAWENVDEFTEYAIALAEVARFIREEMP